MDTDLIARLRRLAAHDRDAATKLNETIEELKASARHYDAEADALEAMPKQIVANQQPGTGAEQDFANG